MINITQLCMSLINQSQVTIWSCNKISLVFKPETHPIATPLKQ